MNERWRYWLSQVVESFRRLPVAQKLVLGCVAAVLASGWVVVFVSSAAPASQPEVPAVSTAVGDDASGTAQVDWLDEGGNWWDPPGTLEAKRLERTKRIVEDTILWSAKIEKARVVIQRAPRSVRGKGKIDSAAVMLQLKSQEDLMGHEKETIKDAVKAAFNLEAGQVVITYVKNDEFSGSDHLLASGGGKSTFQHRLHTQLTEIYDKVYDKEEFELAVNVLFSRRSGTMEQKRFSDENLYGHSGRLSSDSRKPRGQAGGVGPPPPELKASAAKTVKTVLTKIPAGEIQSVQVVLLLDSAAVRRVLRQESGSAEPAPATAEPERLVALGGQTERTRLKSYLKEQEEFLRQLIATTEVAAKNVKVAAAPFKKRAATPEAVLLAAAPPVPPLTARSENPGQVPGPSSRPLWLGAALSTAIFLLALLYRRRRQREVATEASRDGAEAAMQSKLDGLAPHGGPPRGTPPRSERFSPTYEGILRNVDDMSCRVRERPEVAASVLRLWLAQDEESSEQAVEAC